MMALHSGPRKIIAVGSPEGAVPDRQLRVSAFDRDIRKPKLLPALDLIFGRKPLGRNRLPRSKPRPFVKNSDIDGTIERSAGLCIKRRNVDPAVGTNKTLGHSIALAIALACPLASDPEP